MSDVPAGGDMSGESRLITAEAIGQPGERRFRLMAVMNGQTRIVWMEKEQLRQLGEAIEHVLEGLPEQVTPGNGSSLPPSEFDTETPFQIRAGRMELGYDETRKRLVIIAHELEARDEIAPAFECLISPDTARALADEVEIVVSAGRALCPLCGRPMGPGDHVCAKQNGHFPHRLDEVQPEGDEDEIV